MKTLYFRYVRNHIDCTKYEAKEENISPPVVSVISPHQKLSKNVHFTTGESFSA